MLDIERFSKELNIYDCIMLASQAWKSVTEDDLRSAWCRMLESAEESNTIGYEDIRDIVDIMYEIPDFEDISNEEVESWLQHDEFYRRHDVCSTEKLASKDAKQEVKKEEEEENYSIVPDSLEAVKACGVFQRWIFSRYDMTPDQLSTFESMRQLVNNVAVSEQLTQRE